MITYQNHFVSFSLVVNVGMEETEYAFDEDAGQATVCVAVEDDCVIPFQFHVKLRTVERSGGGML